MSAAPAIILMQPQMGENIGACARAMFNFGLTDLRLIAPRDGWPNHEAERNAAGALEKIHTRVFENFNDAVADLQILYATTARRRDLVKPILSAQNAIKESLQSSVKTGFVFGCERTGLENTELALCHTIVQIPVNPDFSSLNLAQAVLLIGYEFWQQQDQSPLPTHEPAAHKDIQDLLTRLEDALDLGGFFKSEELKPTTLNNLRTLITRARMNEQEVRTFHGIITALTNQRMRP